MAICTTEAVVLRTIPFRNTSSIVSLFTRSCGKVQGVAKGIKRRCERKDTRFFCYLEPLTLTKVVYYQKARSGFHLITQCDLLDQFQAIRHDLKKISAASFILELVDKGMQLEDKSEDVFTLLVDALGMICAEKDSKRPLLLFELKFLNLSGLLPHVVSCIRCGRKDLGKAQFNIVHGGLLCSACAMPANVQGPQTEFHHTMLSQGTVASIAHVVNNKWDDIRRFRFTAQAESELSGPIRNFINIHVSNEFKTLDFIQKMEMNNMIDIQSWERG